MRVRSKKQHLKRINQQIEEYVNAEEHWLPNLANAAALLFHELDQVNWVGFYLMTKGTLILGPFQGHTACMRIERGNGVCGTAVKDQKTYGVPDVNEFPGYISCNEETKSEMVIPMFDNGEIVGVLDIDSPKRARFDETDKEYLEQFVKILVKGSNFKL